MPKPAAARTELVRRRIKNSSTIQYLIILAVIIVIVVVALLAGGDKSKPKTISKTPTSACGPYRNDKQVQINGAVFQAELPRNTADFAKGLGGRPCILPNQAMLFVYSKPGRYPFWMKGMKFPIDVIWITADHKVAADEINFKPSTYPEQRANNIPAQYVLEVKANRSKELHIGLGTPVQF